MTAQIPLSAIKSAGIDDYAAAVTEYQAACVAHLETVGKPAPTAHDLVKAAVRRVPVDLSKPDKFVIDYQIIDDLPVSPEVQLLRDTIKT